MTISEDAAAALCRYRFPGNVRELTNAIERAVLLADGEQLELQHFAELVADGPLEADSSQGSGFGLKELVRDFERAQIRDALARAGGNRTETARALGISYRWLLQRIRELDLR